MYNTFWQFVIGCTFAINFEDIVNVHLYLIGISNSELNINAQIIFNSEGGSFNIWQIPRQYCIIYSIVQESSPLPIVSLNIDFRKSKY